MANEFKTFCLQLAVLALANFIMAVIDKTMYLYKAYFVRPTNYVL